MDATIAAQLRAPFPAEKIGKLPRVTCAACRDARTRNCDKHEKARCAECGGWLTTAHLHLDYVGHADTTDRLLAVDPEWTWEPVAYDQAGLPAFDANGGLWIRLTVAGVTRFGYGHSDGKKGGDAVKEAIGDGIRNAALRFGVALDLWHKEIPAVEPESRAPARRARRQPLSTEDRPATDSEFFSMMGALRDAGYKDRDKDRQIGFINSAAGKAITSRKQVTSADVAKVLAALAEGASDDHSERPDGAS